MLVRINPSFTTSAGRHHSTLWARWRFSISRAVPQASRQGSGPACISLWSMARTHATPHLGNYDLVGGTLARVCDHEGNKPRNREGSVEIHVFGQQRQGDDSGTPPRRGLTCFMAVKIDDSS